MSTTTKHGDRIQPGDLAAYKALLLAIAAEAVETSQKPMGEAHLEVRTMVVAQLKTEANKLMELAQKLRS